MRKSILISVCVLVFILSSILLPSTTAETFNLGKKVTESELGSYGKMYYYDSGSLLISMDMFEDSAPKIFDGNNSTGIAKYFGSSPIQLVFKIIFHTPLLIKNITVKPKFGGNASKYSLILPNNLLLADWIDTEKTFLINCEIDFIQFEILTNNNGYAYFNDVIIEYIPQSNNLKDIQKQINKINQDISSIYSDIIVLKNDIIDIKENITNIKKDMPSEYNDSALQNQINNLTQQINSIRENLTEINNNTQQINSLKENLTKINNSIPMKYNDSAIKSNVFSIESENIYLKQQIGNLTVKINNLTTELENISTEVQNLQSGSNAGDKTKDSESIQYMNTLIFGVIIIVLLLIILKLSLTVLKRKHHDIEEPRSDDILISKIKYDILTNKEIKDSRLYDDEYKKLLENGYGKGEMSQETYNYIKTVLEVSERPQNLKNKRT